MLLAVPGAGGGACRGLCRGWGMLQGPAGLWHLWRVVLEFAVRVLQRLGGARGLAVPGTCNCLLVELGGVSAKVGGDRGAGPSRPGTWRWSLGGGSAEAGGAAGAG